MIRHEIQQFMRFVLTPVVTLLVAGQALAQPGGPTKAQIAAELSPKVYQGEQLNTVIPGRTGRLDAAAGRRAWQPGDPIRYVPKRVYPVEPAAAPVNPTTWTLDPLLELQQKINPYGIYRDPARGGGFLSPSLNFPGHSFTGSFPPDTVGDVGPTAYIQMVNAAGGSGVSAWDKNGTFLFSATLSSIGSGVCATGAGDPIVLYDHLADRWLLSEFSGIGNALCVYVSQTSDPGGTYYGYTFTTPNFPDYPKYGLHPDAYTVTTNEPGSSVIYVLARANMLTGGAASATRLTVPDLAGFGFQALTPADLDGPAPGAGEPAYFARHRDDEVHNAGGNDPNEDYIELYSLDVSGGTLTGPQNIPIAEIDSDLCGLFSFFCFEQPNGQRLDPLREVIMWRLQYRNFGQHETLVGNLTTDVNGVDRGGIRWFELRDEGNGWFLFQEGTHSPDTDNRWMGSIAMDGYGNMALGYSVVSPSRFTDILYAGRRAIDPAGTLPEQEGVIGVGSSSQQNERWGDYSAMSVDPTDDCTFWYTNEYITSANNWDTRIATFKHPACGPPVCGDGFIVPPEECDDFNTADGDGCSSNCAVEPGFICTGEPSVCVPDQTGTCLAEDFEGNLPGWTTFNVGALPLNWGRTDDGFCFSNSLSGPGIPPAPNVTGGAGEAACVDSDAAGLGVVESYLCSPEFSAGLGTIELDFLYNYQIYQIPDADDLFSVLIGTLPPSAATIGTYGTVFSTSVNGGGLAVLPGVAQNSDLSAFAGDLVHLCFRYKANFDWYAQVDEMTVTATGGCVAGGDIDGDSVPDGVDNCIDHPNPGQVDTNGDGIGNVCDQDIAGAAGIGADDCVVNLADLSALKSSFFSTQGSPTYNPDADFTGPNDDPDGIINLLDLSRMKASFFGTPGPSANGPCVPITPAITNGSFETGDFTGWTTSDIPDPFFTLQVDGAGVDAGFGFFTSDPADGAFAALHGFDGNGPGVIRIGQDIQIPADQPALLFDYRGAWNLTDFCMGCSDRLFQFHLEPPGGGAPIATGIILTAAAGMTVLDTGAGTQGFDLSSWIGQTLHGVFEWTVPDSNSGPGFFQIDNVRFAPITSRGQFIEVKELHQTH